MKIAIIGVRGLPANYGGFETCVNHTAKHWQAKGHEVLVYCRKSNYSKFPKEYKGIKLRYTSSLPLKGIDTLSHALLSIIDLLFNNRDYKYLHLYNSGNGIFLPLLRLFNRKIIISVDGIEWEREKWNFIAKSTHKIGAYLATKLSHRVVTDNKEVDKHYQTTFKKETSVIAYGAKFIEQINFSGETLKQNNLIAKEYYIFVGRFVPEKGVHHLINTYLKLNTKKPLVIIGDDTNTSEYKKKIEALAKNQSQIILTGFVYNEAYEELLSNAYLYVSASELEGTSPSLLAAMGANVCTLVNGIEENLQTIGGAGTAFSKLDYDDLEKKWQYFEDNPLHTNEMAEKGYQHVVKYYKWDNIAESYLNLFESI